MAVKEKISRKAGSEVESDVTKQQETKVVPKLLAHKTAEWATTCVSAVNLVKRNGSRRRPASE